MYGQTSRNRIPFGTTLTCALKNAVFVCGRDHDIIGDFKLEYEYEIEYEYDFSNLERILKIVTLT